ncbi:Altered inheritance of mitochondria protein 32 [Rhynchospora pubera]|uniref:Altered inheritance of mitochondria protein 32 n=1 Tax=Rhynchospora pubera TaxID=906938 RepID=A0AAV8D8X8_9POAL|nr:Altered inheritance of mitochondria protein 32 [Rhynchospora pubera]
MSDIVGTSPTPIGDALISSPAEGTGSAVGSLQNDGGILAGDAAVAAPYDPESGFHRAEFGTQTLVGTVQYHERHVFLCYKNPQVWPSHLESSESDRLPRLLSAALKSRKGAMKKSTRLTICEGEDGTDASNGDVLIFPDMIRYRRLTHFDVETFVEEALVKDTEWLPGSPTSITGAYVFVCAHGSRDKRCGTCGPALIKKFKEEIGVRGLQDLITVSGCSHIGGHKYAGNVIIFSLVNGEVAGHWYGYVAPDDVAVLLDQHIGKGEVVDHLWRGQLGLSEEDQKNALELKRQLANLTEQNSSGCCQGGNGNVTCCQGSNGNATCCQNGPQKETNSDINRAITEDGKDKTTPDEKTSSSARRSRSRKVCHLPTWFETWEKEDTYAVLAVAAAGAAICVAYSMYKHHHSK